MAPTSGSDSNPSWHFNKAIPKVLMPWDSRVQIGLRVRCYHLTNPAIHILAGLVLFGIARRTLLLFLTRAPYFPPRKHGAHRLGPARSWNVWNSLVETPRADDNLTYGWRWSSAVRHLANEVWASGQRAAKKRRLE